ncbi:MAG: molybdenum cofactor guanylyltransferase [Cellvibrionales bacterium]|nr:molybdenum cofactor guanylyltransferase [Porticoccaceae bacterium]|tara:strand:+ start:62206 stop:62814 length:609 start_codon:yes stop_codon:yes gene_type:complete
MKESVDGVILAAGRSSRMATGDKAQAMLGGRTLLAHVADRFAPQVRQLVINADPVGSPSLAQLPYPLVKDALDGFRGPLVGLYSALLCEWLSDAAYLALVPCDGPFVPDDLVDRLHHGISTGSAQIACARYAGVAQPTFSMWRKDVFSTVERALLEDQNGGFKPLMTALKTVYIDWPTEPNAPFFNINNGDDLARAERLLCV